MISIDSIRRWSHQVRNSFKKQIRLPEMIELTDVTSKPIRFRVYNSVERFRVKDYGGERDELKLFLEMLKPDDIVYDIGASIGLYTVASAVLLGKGEVWAFEPDPETHSRLVDNIRLNGLLNAHTQTWAVSDCEGITVLHTDGASGFAPSLRSKGDHRGAPKGFRFKGQVRVKTQAIDNVLKSKGLPLPSVLKIDVEGAEGLVIKGAFQLLMGCLGSKPRVILLELHPEFLPSYGASVEEVHELLLSMSYSALWEQERCAQILRCYQEV